jgi:hypothetical protein
MPVYGMGSRSCACRARGAHSALTGAGLPRTAPVPVVTLTRYPALNRDPWGGLRLPVSPAPGYFPCAPCVSIPSEVAEHASILRFRVGAASRCNGQHRRTQFGPAVACAPRIGP